MHQQGNAQLGHAYNISQQPLACMLDEKKSLERQFYKEALFEKLKKIQQTFQTANLYVEERAESILWSIFSNAELFGTGLSEVLTKTSMGVKEIGKAVVVAVLDDYGQAEVEKSLHYFSEIFVVNLTISNNQTAQSMKVSPIRKKLRGFIEISLNFLPFIDTVYAVNEAKRGREVGFVEGFTSYLVSLPKFHQFQINYSKSEENIRLAAALEQSLSEKLGILMRYESSQYKASASPRIKVLLIDRKIDAMSPLLYSYFYGPIAMELQLLDEHKQFSSKSVLFSALYPMDIQEASEFLVKLSAEKAATKKETIDKSEVQQIKKAITIFCDNTASSKEIEIHINSLQTVKEFCKRRAVATALQQTILNNRSEADEKMSPSKIIDRIIEWGNLPLEEFKASEEDYIKMLVLSYMVNSFWFFQRRIINACLDGPRKQQILSFCKKVENTYKPLREKQQGEHRYDLYRHEPAIIAEIDSWLANKQQYQEKTINQSSVNRESHYIMAVNGPLGYNQACFIQRYLSQRQQKVDVTIFCQRLVTTKDYLNHLLKSNRSQQ